MKFKNIYIYKKNYKLLIIKFKHFQNYHPLNHQID